MSNLATYGKKYLIPLANCRFTAGVKRALLCDLQRGEFLPVPLSLMEIVNDGKGKRLDTIYADYDDDQHDTLDGYFDFLLKGEYIYLSDHEADVLRFSKLNLDFKTPERIQNAIIDLDEYSGFDPAEVVRKLTRLDCLAIQVRAYCKLTLHQIATITQAATETTCRNIEFIVPYEESIVAYENLEAFFIDHQLIGSITCYLAPVAKTDWYLGHQTRVDYITEKVTDETHCGQFHPFYFVSNMLHFTESQQYNTCLHRKISIDKRGYIKNCPAMATGYGHIETTNLETVLDNEAFKKPWTIHKELIKGCKDCEFRHVCTDCRAYLEDPADQYSKPLKCGYDPYTATWQDWSQNPLKQQTFNDYSRQKIVQA